MEFIEKIYSRVKNTKKRILLPEGETPRVLKAVREILKKDICMPILFGDPAKIADIAKKEGVDIKDAEILSSKELKDLDKYVALYREVRKHKNIKEDEACRLISDNPVFYAALGVRSGDFDGFVAGAATTTREVARAAIHCIGAGHDTPTISSYIILITSDKNIGSNGVFILADAGIVPDPTSEQLRDIAVASSKMAEMLLDDEPKIAMLSYSTKGSGGSSKSIEKVRRATCLISEKFPDLLVDGEIQLDCAIVPEVAKRKDPNSRLKGRANVLIFPDLDAGNISYKIAERMASAHALGPILQGLRRPASDLSRGCSTHDIVDTVAVIALKAQTL